MIPTIISYPGYKILFECLFFTISYRIYKYGASHYYKGVSPVHTLITAKDIQWVKHNVILSESTVSSAQQFCRQQTLYSHGPQPPWEEGVQSQPHLPVCVCSKQTG